MKLAAGNTPDAGSVSDFTRSRLVPVMVRLSTPGFAGFGDTAVPRGSMIVRSVALTTFTGEACFMVNLPFSAPPGTFTTISVADWLSKVATVLSPANVIDVTRSRSVPVIVRLSVWRILAGENEVIAGNVTVSSVSEAKDSGFVPPDLNTRIPDCALIGTFTFTSPVDLLTNSVTEMPSLKTTSSIQFTRVPLIDISPPGLASPVIDVIFTGTLKLSAVFVVMSPSGVLRTTSPASASSGTTNSMSRDVFVVNADAGTSAPGSSIAVTLSRFKPMNFSVSPCSIPDGPKLLSTTADVPSSSSLHDVTNALVPMNIKRLAAK